MCYLGSKHTLNNCWLLLPKYYQWVWSGIKDFFKAFLYFHSLLILPLICIKILRLFEKASKSKILSSSSVSQCSRSVMSNSLRSHGLQHARLLCPSPTPGAYSNSCPSRQWCHPTISSSVAPFSCLQSFPASGSFPMSRFFTSGGQSIGVSASASVLPVNIQKWFPLGLTGWISL